MRYDLEFRSIPGVLRVNGRRLSDRESLVDPDSGRRWTFAELEAEMVRSVRAAIAAGVRPGDRVGIWLPNSAEWIIAALGVLGAGGVLVPLNTRFKAEEAAYVLRKSGARMLIAGTDFLGMDHLRMLRSGEPDLAKELHTVCALGAVPEGAVSWDDHLAAGVLVPETTAIERIDAITGDDLSDIMFTSGTTGAPKGVMLTHAQSLRAHGYLSAVFGFALGDRYLVIPPFFHTFGYKAGWMASLMHGVTVIPQRIFDVDEVLGRIERERVTVLLGPPTLFNDLMRHPRRGDHDLSSLRFTVPSAAVVPVELVHRLHDDLGFDVVLTAYGLTEATSMVSTCRPEDDPEDIANSVGRPAQDVEVTLIDAEGGPVAPGEAGEVLVRGYVVMRGYWEDPEATAEVIDADGWLHTGDIGTLNERGFLRITDRKKDMFIAGGFNAYPAEIERLLLRYEAVADVAVIGVPDDRLGEVGAAFVVPAAGQDVRAADLIAWAREHMANYKVPRHVHLVAELPRNASMKVRKADLRAQFARAAAPSGLKAPGPRLKAPGPVL
jgi:acyl-CoA synthetase (AMP-forming)/AMP-acid ligase II